MLCSPITLRALSKETPPLVRAESCLVKITKFFRLIFLSKIRNSLFLELTSDTLTGANLLFLNSLLAVLRLSDAIIPFSFLPSRFILLKKDYSFELKVKEQQ